jgi:hypothetical protein
MIAATATSVAFRRRDLCSRFSIASDSSGRSWHNVALHQHMQFQESEDAEEWQMADVSHRRAWHGRPPLRSSMRRSLAIFGIFQFFADQIQGQRRGSTALKDKLRLKLKVFDSSFTVGITLEVGWGLHAAT